MRFLIAEVDPKFADFICEGLRQEGHDVAAADGASALAHIAQGLAPFDALVLDVMLPRLDKFGVLRALRQRGVTSPVLILRAFDSGTRWPGGGGTHTRHRLRVHGDSDEKFAGWHICHVTAAAAGNFVGK